MSAWEFIGWLIAVPMILFTGLLVYAFLAAIVKLTVKRRNQNETVSRTFREWPY